MTDKPNHSLKDLLNELKEKEKGCGKTFDNLICGVSYDSSYKPTRFLYCPSCQKYKQGLIQGAKMMIEDEKVKWNNIIKYLNKDNSEIWDVRINVPDKTKKKTKYCNPIISYPIRSYCEHQLADLKQLNNWLEKE